MTTPPPTIAGLVDTHCHLDYPPMSEDVAATLARAAAAGVVQVVHIGCSVDRLQRAIQLADAHDGVFAVIGIHPHDAMVTDDGVLARLEALARHPKVVAIGESGLDYHYDRSPRAKQIESLERHIALATSLDKPLVLHIRDAHDEALAVVAQQRLRDRPGIVHCFTGGPDEAERWLAAGFHLSFSGIATFPNAEPIRMAARVCPPDRVLLETDAPFLTPVPLRGRKNEPANVAFTCVRLAKERGEDPAVLAAHAAGNARLLLGLPEPVPVQA